MRTGYVRTTSNIIVAASSSSPSWLEQAGNLQFRVDFINLFIDPNLAPVDFFMGDPGFAKLSTLLPVRQLQLGIRLAF